MKINRIIAAVGAGALLAAGGVLGVATAASAHTPDITGAASCQDDGTYTIDWSVTTTNVPDGQSATITNASANPNGQWPNGVPTSIDGNTTIHVQETGIAGDSTSAQVQADFTWSDYGPVTKIGTVALDGNCTTPTPPAQVITPPQITATAGMAVCDDGESVGANGTITLPAFEGGHWAEHDAGTITDVPPGDYMFTAVADDGYTLAPVDGLDPSQWGARFVTVPASTSIDCVVIPPKPDDRVTTSTSTQCTPEGGTGTDTVTTVTVTHVYDQDSNTWVESEPVSSIDTHAATAEECPAVVVAPTTPPTSAPQVQQAAASDVLADTGSDLTWPISIGIVILGAGSILTTVGLIARRRRV